MLARRWRQAEEGMLPQLQPQPQPQPQLPVLTVGPQVLTVGLHRHR